MYRINIIIEVCCHIITFGCLESWQLYNRWARARTSSASTVHMVADEGSQKLKFKLLLGTSVLMLYDSRLLVAAEVRTVGL
jgi:hypothetical protein